MIPKSPVRAWSRVLLAAAALATASLAVTTGDSAAAAPNQRTLFAYSGAQTASNYWTPPVSQPASYVSPANYAGGHFYLKLVVTSKPSNKLMLPQVCFWRHADKPFQYETCGGGQKFTSTGTYWVDLGAANRWWKKNGSYDWSKQASVIRIMLKDPATGKLFLSQRCGAACYTGGDLGDHVPVQFRGELVMVPMGATLSPPAGWAGCPASWSLRC